MNDGRQEVKVIIHTCKWYAGTRDMKLPTKPLKAFIIPGTRLIQVCKEELKEAGWVHYDSDTNKERPHLPFFIDTECSIVRV